MEGTSPLWREAEADAVERMATIGGAEWDFLADPRVAEMVSASDIVHAVAHGRL